MVTPRRFLPSIASLRALEALDRLGSASAVAQDLSLTQSAVSRQLQTLEKQLGMDLIQRVGKRLVLTPAARDYAADTRQALNQIANASLRLQTSSQSDALNLAMLPTFGMRWLMPRLPDFSRRHPEVAINMTTRLQRFNFSDEPFDAAIHFGKPDWPGTQSLLLKYEQVLPVCAPDLVGATSVRKPQDILMLPLLHIQTRPDAWKTWFGQHGIRPGKVQSGTVYDQFATISQAAQHGLGVALLPVYLIEQDLASGRLLPLHPVASETDGAYYLVWPEARPEASALQQFRRWLETQAEPEDLLPR
jgi:LysR family transcriptional regulator, glycine cleavage system transcriptional activator